MRDNQQTVKIELLSQWKLEAEFRNFHSALCIPCDTQLSDSIWWQCDGATSSRTPASLSRSVHIILPPPCPRLLHYDNRQTPFKNKMQCVEDFSSPVCQYKEGHLNI